MALHCFLSGINRNYNFKKMNTLKTIATILLLTLFLQTSYAVATIQSVDSILYKAYIANNKDLTIALLKDLENKKPSLENTYLLLKA